MQKLRDKVALITGGGTGIGRAVALLFADHGADVAICGPDAPPLEETARQIEAAGRRARTVTGDISIEADVRRIVEQTVRSLGGLDMLVNNAAVTGQVAPVVESDLSQWEQTLRINLTGAMLCCREAIPHMVRRGGGAIVNVSSNVGRRGLANRASYVCSKWALLGLTQTLALETARQNIRVNAICPGPVETERMQRSRQQMAGKRGVSVEAIRQEWLAQSPMNRFVTPEECAEVALFLASDASSAMTGQALNVTAGAMMT